MKTFEFQHNNTFGVGLSSFTAIGDDEVDALRRYINSGIEFGGWCRRGGGFQRKIDEIQAIVPKNGILGGRGGYEVVAKWMGEDNHVFWFTHGKEVATV